MQQIPYAKQNISADDIKAVVDVLVSEYLTQGPTIEKFEKMIAAYCGAEYAVAVNSATAALHIACLAADLQPGEISWTVPNTFVASANCGLYCGADVDFVDIDPHTYNMSCTELEKKIKMAKSVAKLPKIIIPVHFAGQSCEMKEIHRMASEHGIIVIEDASHAIGGSYLDSKVGSCCYSDMTVFSFHPVKIVTTAEGGMVLTNRKDLYEKLIRLRSHGITRDVELMTEESHGPWYYQQIDLGMNYRMTDIQASLGISQFARIEEFVARRQHLAKRYNNQLIDLPVVLPRQNPDTYSAYHLYVIRLQLDKISKTHRQVFEELRQAGIGVNLHYIPIHTQPYYRKLGFKQGDFPVAERYYTEAITLPLYYGLTEKMQDYVIETLKAVLR